MVSRGFKITKKMMKGMYMSWEEKEELRRQREKRRGKETKLDKWGFKRPV